MQTWFWARNGSGSLWIEALAQMSRGCKQSILGHLISPVEHLIRYWKTHSWYRQCGGRQKRDMRGEASLARRKQSCERTSRPLVL